MNTNNKELAASTPQDVIKRLMTTTKQPQLHKVTVLRYSKTALQKKVNAKQWRTILKEKMIIPNEILFPRYITLELVIPADLEQTTWEFFCSLYRETEDSNPFTRMDGQRESLPLETILRELTYQILKFEISTLGVRYIRHRNTTDLGELQKGELQKGELQK